MSTPSDLIPPPNRRRWPWPLLRARDALVVAILLAPVARAEVADEIHWTVTGQNSITLDWRGSVDTVRFGVTSLAHVAVGVAPVPVPFSSTGPFREARLTSLTTNAIYHYRIGGGLDHTFRAPPPHGSANFSVMVEADMGDGGNNPGMPGVQAVIASQKPAFVLAVGDLTYGDHHGKAAVDGHFNDVMVWSLGTAYMPAWGNAEWDVPSGDDLRNYKGRFDLPHPRTSPGSPAISCCGEDWYWFDYGNTRFISCPEPWSGARSDWYPRARAVMDSAQADRAISYIVTFGHRPAYTAGYYRPGDTELRAYLDSLGDTHPKYVLDLAGHDHGYQRSYPQHGVVHVIAGTGGASLYPLGTKPSWLAAHGLHLGSLRLWFGRLGIEGRMLCGPPSSYDDVVCTAVLDSFFVANPNKTVDTPGSPDVSSISAWMGPNPFVSHGTLSFILPHESAVRVELFDVTGKRVRTLLDATHLVAGLHQIEVQRRLASGSTLRSGAYFYRIAASGDVVTGRFVLE